MNKQHRHFIGTIAVIIIMLALFCLPASADTMTIRPTFGQSEARNMLSDLNRFRTSYTDAWYYSPSNQKVYAYGLSSLTYDYTLEKIAMQRAAEIAVSYNHTRPNGLKASSIYDEYNYTWYSVGENIAAGYMTGSYVFDAWREDYYPYAGQGHRRNMLSEDYKAVGIGHAIFNGQHYWVQVFSDRARNTSYTSPCNSEKEMTINYSANSVVSRSAGIVERSSSTLSVACGFSITLPTATGTMCLSGTWPQKAFPVETSVSWTSSNKSYATVSNGKVTGKKVGSVTLTANCGSVKTSITLQITPKSLTGASITLASSSLSYTGSPVVPTISKISVGGVTLSKSDYKVTAKNNSKIGTGTITITGTGNYQGSVSKTFQIVAPTTKLTYYSNTSAGKLGLKWVKRSGITGYQIKYVTGSTIKAITVSSASKTSATITGLKKGKTYKIYIRTYKSQNGTKCYSSWSSPISIKIKK